MNFNTFSYWECVAKIAYMIYIYPEGTNISERLAITGFSNLQEYFHYLKNSGILYFSLIYFSLPGQSLTL